MRVNMRPVYPRLTTRYVKTDRCILAANDTVCPGPPRGRDKFCERGGPDAYFDSLRMGLRRRGGYLFPGRDGGDRSECREAGAVRGTLSEVQTFWVGNVMSQVMAAGRRALLTPRTAKTIISTFENWEDTDVFKGCR